MNPPARRTRHTCFLLLLAMTGVSQPLAADVPADLALVHCNVFTAEDAQIRADATVLVRSGKIVSIETNGPVLEATVTIDCENHYLMPGLIDAHTHLDNLAAARRALESGVTTVRSASTPAFQDIGLRELVRKGALPGPEVVAAGVFVTPNLEETILADPRLAGLVGGVDAEEELRLLVRVNVDHGVDVIKTRATERAGRSDTDPRQQVYSHRQLEIIVDAAGRHGIPVMVHAHGDEGALAAVQAGVRSIEHGTYLSERTLRLMKEKGTWFVPTYVTMFEMNEEQYDHVLRLRGMHMVPKLEDAIRNAHRIGVRFATGADNYYDEKSVNRVSVEAMYLQRFGLSPLEALQAATTSAAELLMVHERTGKLAPGYEADMILVPANPLEDIMALQDVLLVVSNGQVAMKRIPFALAP